MMIPLYLRELRKQMTGRQWVGLVKAHIDLAVAYQKVLIARQEMEKYGN